MLLLESMLDSWRLWGFATRTY